MRLSSEIEKELGGTNVPVTRLVRDAVNVTGYNTFGLSLQGPWKHVDYLWRVIEGEEEPESVPEFAAALMIGKREER